MFVVLQCYVNHSSHISFAYSDYSSVYVYIYIYSCKNKSQIAKHRFKWINDLCPKRGARCISVYCYTYKLHISVWFFHFLFSLEAGAISIHSPQRSLVRSVQEDVLFSVDVTCDGVPTIQWTFMSAAVSRTIGTWQLEAYTNITEDYSSRVQAYSNGSISLSDLRLQDAGYYVITVTEAGGSSRDAGFVLKVNGECRWVSVCVTDKRLHFGKPFLFC